MTEYDKIVDKLRSATKDTGKEQEVINNVLREIHRSGNPALGEILFGWADSLWLRRSLSTAAICIIVFFVVQQSMIINKIELIEKRVVEVSTKNILDKHKENALSRAVVFKENEDINMNDSIKVSNKDLGDLLRSYRELQEEYKRIKEELREEKGNMN